MFFNDFIGMLLKAGARQNMTTKQFLEKEIYYWINSPERQLQLTGDSYYRQEQAIEHKQRTVIGENGTVTTVHNLPNNRLSDNRYAFLVDQKANYLLAKPVDARAANESAQDMINEIFGPEFRRTLRAVGKDALNCGISYLFPYVNNDGELTFKRLHGYEILPFWKDQDHTALDAFLRMYPQEVYEGQTKKIVHRVEWYTLDGVQKFIYEAGTLKPESTDIFPYVVINSGEGEPEEAKAFNWTRIPLIPFKLNSEEIPLIKRVKSLQDALNVMYSGYMDNMQEDPRNAILVLHNYDGQNMAEFRRNLATYGGVKVRDPGGVDVLAVPVNSENYQAIINLLKRAIIENGRGLDTKDDRLTAGSPNMMNIRSMYTDLDLDADDMELEFQASMANLMWFVNTFNAALGRPVTDVQFIFNRDTMVNESEVISDCRSSVGIISQETIIANHPWVKDSKKELEKVQQEQAQQMAAMDPYGGNEGWNKNSGTRA